MPEIQGRVWVFGNSVDTDAIVPGRLLDAPLEEAAGCVLESLNPEFAASVKPGDIIAAGDNFGCGSSREQAASVLKFIGIQCVLAESFGRIFFRNAIAVGLPVLVCPGVSTAFADGDEASASIRDGRVVNIGSGRALGARPLSGNMLEILEKGGAVEYLKELAGRRI